MSGTKRLLVFAVFSFAIFCSLGWYIHQGISGNSDLSTVYKNINKFSTVVTIADKYYFDEIQWGKVFESALNGMLKELDPHSIYINKTNTEQNDAEFEGHYYGIGIEFDIIDDYITIVKALPGSPSEKLGLMSNDKIIKINGEDAYGISRSDVPKKLKGPKGSTVSVTIQRDDLDEFDVVIERDEIPTFSVLSYFMLNKNTGYLHLEKFIATSSDEVEEALQSLESQGMKQLIFDLRGNGGGFLDQAVKISSKFLKGRKKVVFTKGKIKEFDETLYTDNYERLHEPREYPLIVLIDRNSASASEIVTGALQDYDRALIVGERSFGKGLVQRPFPLNDGSSFRLTIARYYTPTGRLIQRDYKGKTLEQYYREVETDTTRYRKTTVADSVEQFETLFLKRKVYGGGGITPDSLVRLKYEYLSNPKLFGELISKKVFFDYTIKYKDEINKYQRNKEAFMLENQFGNEHLNRLFKIAKERGVQLEEAELMPDKNIILRRLKASIANLLWDNLAYFEVYRRADKNIEEAAKLFKNANRMVFK